MSIIPAPPRSAFRNHLGLRFIKSCKRGMFLSCVTTVAFCFAHTIPELRQVGVAWNTTNEEKLFKEMRAAGAFQYIDKDGKFHYPDEDD